MRASHIEQLGWHERPGAYRRWVKRAAVRRLRRAAKANPEHAPTRVVFRGYTT